MRPWKSLADDGGSASLEFVTTGMILLLPLVYLILTLSAIQAGAFAVEAAARQAARVFVRAADSDEAEARALAAIELALGDYGIEAGDAQIEVRCSPRPSICLNRRGFVTVSVEAAVPLPLLPSALGTDLPLAVRLQSSSTQQVSRFWSGG